MFTEKDHHDNMVYAPHWYDLNCVFYKKFDGRITHDVQSLQKVRFIYILEIFPSHLKFFMLGRQCD